MPTNQNWRNRRDSRGLSVEAARESVAQAAGVGAGLWFTYIFAMFYMFVTLGSLAHVDLFFGVPVKLPLLDVELPLQVFFVVAPAMVLVLHAYVMVHLVVLANKAADFDDVVSKSVRQADAQRSLRRALPSNIFAQLLAGPDDVRRGRTGVLLVLIAFTTLIFLPVSLLLQFQLTYLPYHSLGATWWHRLVIIADMVLLWMYVPVVWRANTKTGSLAKHITFVRSIAAAVTVLLVVFATSIAVIPDEWVARTMTWARVVPVHDQTGWTWRTLTTVLFEGDVDGLTKKVASPWSNRLVLTSWLAPGDRGASDKPRARSFRGRNLDRMVLSGADLAGSDFTGAKLTNARIEDSNLSKSEFGCGDLDSKDVKRRRCAELDRAIFFRVNLADSELDGLQADGLWASATDFSRARFREARMHGASFYDSEFEGANFSSASLVGARWISSRLRGADMAHARLVGAVIYNSLADGGRFLHADMRGVDLRDTSLVAAEMSSADLRGSWFKHNSMQGADMTYARLQSALINKASVWGTTTTNTQLEGVIIAQLDSARYPPDYRCPDKYVLAGRECDWVSAIAKFASMSRPTMNEVAREEWAKHRASMFATDVQAPGKVPEPWEHVADNQPAAKNYVESLATLFDEIICGFDDGEHVLSALLQANENDNLRDQALVTSKVFQGALCTPAHSSKVMREELAQWRDAFERRAERASP